MLVQNILSSKPVTGILTISASKSVADAAAILSEKRIGALIVSEDGQTVAGIISERDIVRRLGSSGPDCLSMRVGDLMTADVVACAPGDSAVSVLERMTAGRFRHMPVVADGKLVGVISIGDVVKARIDEVEHENSALTDMIAGHS